MANKTYLEVAQKAMLYPDKCYLVTRKRSDLKVYRTILDTFKNTNVITMTRGELTRKGFEFDGTKVFYG